MARSNLSAGNTAMAGARVETRWRMNMAEQPNPKPEREIDLEHELVDAAFQVTPGGPMELEKKFLPSHSCSRPAAARGMKR